MGSKAAKTKTSVEWPTGAPEMRAFLYPQLVKQMRGEETFADKVAGQRQVDNINVQAAIEKERLLRSMGRMPGVPGPERYQELRRVTDSSIDATARANVMARTNMQQQALSQALQYAMQPGVQKQTSTGGKKGWGEAAGTIAGAAVGTMVAPGAGTMVGAKIGGQLGGSGGGGAAPATTSMPQGPAEAYPEGFTQSFAPNMYGPNYTTAGKLVAT